MLTSILPLNNMSLMLNEGEKTSTGTVLSRVDGLGNRRGDINGKSDHIGVCVCTYKRPRLLAQLLEKLERQKAGGYFCFSIHIVDNDSMKSAEETVLKFMQSAEVSVTYDNVPIQNIALARNRAVQVAEGNYISFIDDDELPVEDWLMQLYLCLRRHGAAGVLGPVRPLFPREAPAWLVRSGLCDRPSHASGTVLNFLQTRTGNVLFDRRIIKAEDAPFPPERGRTGGEDIAFFRKMMARGHTFIWCEEAPVYEKVFPERFKRAYYFQKNLRIGGLTGALLRELGRKKWSVLMKSAVSVAAHGFLSAIGAIFGQHIFMRHFTKMIYHLARIAGGFGFVPIRERMDV